MKSLIAIILSVFLVGNALFAQTFVSELITKTEFDNEFFGSNQVWYSQFQAGGTGSEHPDNEYEYGKTLRQFVGNTTITDEVNNPFLIEVSGSNSLSVSFNGNSLGEGFTLGVTDKYNVVWVGLTTDTLGASETIDALNQVVDSENQLSDLMVQGSQDFVGLKFYYENTDNIGSISFAGNIFPDAGGTTMIDENWTYTVFATHDSAIPEPKTYPLFFGIMAISLVIAKKRK